MSKLVGWSPNRILLLLVLVIFSSSLSIKAQAGVNPKSLVCYYNVTSFWREAQGKFQTEDIDPHLCTHILYSYLGVSERTNRLYSLDPGLDLGAGEIETDPDPPGPGQSENNKGDLDMIRKTVGLRAENPDLKVLISVGGKGQSSRVFSNMARHISNRTQFINSSTAFIEKYSLDGLDVDWEFPSQGSGRPEDKQNLVSLFKELKEALRILSGKTGRKYILTGAFGCRKEVVDTGYDLVELVKYVDGFHLMCFDLKMFSGEDKLIGHHSPLHSKSTEAEKDKELSAEFGVNLFLSSGVPAEKLFLGMSSYGRTYEVSEGNVDFYDEAVGPGNPGFFTLQPGIISYYEICWELRESLGEWNMGFDYDYQVPFGFNTSMWIGYDNEISGQEKVDFAVGKGLGGMMLQFIDMDDCQNICKGWVPCPITAALKDRLNNPPNYYLQF